VVTPASPDLLALARKYQTLGDLRRLNPTGETPEERRGLRAIATEFPGALRELDTLPLDEIERRRDALTQAAQGHPVEPWMAWMHAYHGLMRTALSIRRALGRRALASADRANEVADDVAARLAANASAGAPIAIDASLVRALRKPPDGRISVVVFDRLGALFGVPPSVIWDTLFPPRRPGRY
jgi:hypothetical protein